MFLRFTAIGVVVLCTTCGGRVGSGADSGIDAATPDGGLPWTDCSSPAGYAICGGPKACAASNLCPKCEWLPGQDTREVTYCDNDALFRGGDPGGSGGCFECTDGHICVAPSQTLAKSGGVGWGCAGFELGLLFKQAGAAKQVLYADNSTFTGDPLPQPSSCPSLAGIRLCGGACGNTCGAKEVCTGRSPLHPHSLCLPDVRSEGSRQCDASHKPRCINGNFCLVFKVQPEAQPFADATGVCMSPADCQAAAQGYPGGATCLPDW